MKRSLLCLLLLLITALAAGQLVWPEEMSIRDGQDLHYFGGPVKDYFGNVFNVWVKSTHGKHVLRAELYQADGSSLWRAPLLIWESQSPIIAVKTTATTDNCFIISWQEAGSHTGGRLMMQKVSSSGILLWGDGINAVPERIQTMYAYDIAPNNEGGAYFFYSEENGQVIRGRNYNGLGNEVWGDNAPIISTAGGVILSGIASLLNYGVALHYKSTVNEMNYVERYEEWGYRVWQQSYPFEPGEDTRPHEIFVTPGHNCIDMVRTINTDTRLKIRAFNSSGTQFLNPAFELVLADSPAEVDYVVEQEGISFSVLVQKYQNLQSEIRYYFIRGDIMQVYPAGGLLVGTYAGSTRDPRISCDITGKVYFAWVNEGTATEQLAMNMIHNDLQAAWGPTGVIMCSSDRNLGVFDIKGVSTGVMLNYQTEDVSNKSLKMQIITPQGDLLLIPGGQNIVSARTGHAHTVATHHLENRVLVFYMDYNEDNLAALYYQILSADGNPVIPQPVRMSEYSSQPGYITSCNYNSVNAAVIFRQGTGYYLQLISYWGMNSYNLPGIFITNQASSLFKMNEFNLSLYIGWMENSSAGHCKLMGQRFYNSEMVWGYEGKVLVDDIPSAGCALGASDGSYYTWLGRGPDDTYKKVYSLLVNANGDPYPGWNPAGEVIYDNPQDTDQRPFWAQRYGNDMILVLGGFAPSPVTAVKVNIDHSLPWSLQGLQVTPGGVFYVSCAAQNDGFAVLYGSPGPINPTVSYQVVSAEGTLLHESPGLTLQNLTPGTGAPQVRLAAFQNGAYVAIWNAKNSWEEQDLFYRLINPQGFPQGNGSQVLSAAPGDQQYPYLSAAGNEAVVVWRNQNSDDVQGYNAYFEGLVAQKISANPSSVAPEPELTPSVLNIKYCYPNPFRASATVVWEQKNPDHVEIDIYNLKGQLVRKFSPAFKEAGEHQQVWDGTNEHGRLMGPGLYFVRVKSGKAIQIGKLVKY